MLHLIKKKSTCSKRTPTHVTHNVVVKNGSAPSWRGNLKLLASRSMSKLSVRNVNVKLLATESTRSLSSDYDSTENLSCASESGSDDIVYSDKSQGIFSFYQEGDGSAEDPDGIPTRYLDLTNQDRVRAMEAVEKTVQWREENGINDMLNKAHVKFDICKAAVPHFYAGRDAKGHVVYVQRPARLDMELCKANGVTHEDLLLHAIYIQEYIWQIIEADNPTATVTSIIDAGDLCFGDLRQKDKTDLLTKMATVFDTHFPMRGHKTFIVNAPSWFNMLWRMVKPVLRETTTDMIEICAKGKNQDAILVQAIGEETCRSLPDFCWSDAKKSSTNGTSTDQLQMEKDLRAFVLSRIEANGETMQPVLP